MTYSSLGKQRRMNRIFSDGRALIVPVDDSLIDGPKDGLHDLEKTINKIIAASPSAMLGFKTEAEYITNTSNIPFIFNITASTVLSSHTRKVMIATVENAISAGADCIAAHINFTGQYESEMLAQFAAISNECDKFGIPLMAMAYPRKEVKGKDYNYLDLRKDRPDEYTELIAHCVRVVCELGADIVKTQYTGSEETFKYVTESACGKPVVIAGGSKETVEESFRRISSSIRAGGSGICFGRNIFNSNHIYEFVSAAKSIIFNDCDYMSAFAKYIESTGGDIHA